MVSTVTSSIAKLDGVCDKLKMKNQKNELNAASRRLNEHVFSVGIMGEFRRGKSTVINALLGADIVPADIVPCSATLNYIKWDAQKSAEIKFKSGEKTWVDVNNIRDYVTKLTDESAKMAESVDSATIYYPCKFCQNGVQIVDTPGLNDDERMTAIAENVIPKLDAIIMVLIPDSPFSQSESEFVRNKLMTSDLGRLIFVVNKIDNVDPEDRGRVIEFIKGNITKSVLEKTAAIYGEGSEEYRSTKTKLGEIRVLPVSARQALKAKKEGDNEKLRESGFAAFESELSRLLTEERGMIELVGPVSRIVKTSVDALELIKTRRDAISIDAKEFETLQKESVNKIKETRTVKMKEIKELKKKSKNLFKEMEPKAKAVYDDVEKVLRDFVAAYPLQNSDFSDEMAIKKFNNDFTKAMDAKLEESLAISTERLLHEIKSAIGQDVAAIKEFNERIDSELLGIREDITIKSNKSRSGGSGAGLLAEFGANAVSEVALGGFIPGLGGLISGFKQHGGKGALVGGVSGWLIGLGTVSGCVAAGVFGLPAILIGAAASALGGRAITNAIFGKKTTQKLDDIDTIRRKMETTVIDVLNAYRSEKPIEKWIEETCNVAYEKIVDGIDNEWESALSNMETTISDIKVDIEKNASNKDKIDSELQDQEKIVLEVVNNIKPVQARLEASAASI